MKKKRWFTMIGSICLSLVLAALLLPACAPAAPAELEEELAAEKAKVAAEKAKVSDMEKEIAALKKPAEAIKWKYQCIHTPGSTDYESEVELVEAVKAMSNGRFELILYPAEELVAAPELADALASGLIQFTMTSGGYYKGSIPEMMLEPSNWPPVVVRQVEDQTELCFYRGLNDLTREGLLPYNIYYIMPYSFTPVRFWSKEPMYGIDEIKGFKIRLWGSFVDVFNAVGASAVYLPHSEVYTAIATGVLDGGGGLCTFYDTMYFHELCPYYYNVPIIAGGLGIFTSLDAWNELPDDLKAILTEGCMSMRAKNYALNMHSFYEMFKKFDDWGTTVIIWPDEDLNPLAAASMKIIDEIAEASPVNAQAMQILTDFMEERGYID